MITGTFTGPEQEIRSAAAYLSNIVTTFRILKESSTLVPGEITIRFTIGEGARE